MDEDDDIEGEANTNVGCEIAAAIIFQIVVAFVAWKETLGIRFQTQRAHIGHFIENHIFEDGIRTNNHLQDI